MWIHFWKELPVEIAVYEVDKISAFKNYNNWCSSLDGRNKAQVKQFFTVKFSWVAGALEFSIESL